MTRLTENLVRVRTGLSVIIVLLVLLTESGTVLALHVQPSAQTPTSLYQASSNSYVGTFYVSTTGNDKNTGTSSSPWRTVQKAANTLTAGQTVLVQAGTYSERVGVTISGSSGSIITFQAQGTVVMQGFDLEASYITIDGFSIANTGGSGWDDRSDGSGVYMYNANYNVISDNSIDHTTAAGIYVSSNCNHNLVSANIITYAVECGIYAMGTYNVIDSNDISHTRDIGNSDADGVRFFGTGNIFRRNHIHDIILSDSPGVSPHADGFQTWGPASNIIFEQNIVDLTDTDNQGMTIEGPQVGNIMIRNNIFITHVPDGYSPCINVGDTGLVTNTTIANNDMIAANGPVEYAIWIFQYAQGVLVKNNVMYNHGNSVEPYIQIDSGASGLDIGSNAIFKSDNQMPKGGCLPNDYCFVNPSVSPGFVNLASGDFHLQSKSPLIDKGIALSQVTSDFDGVARPRDGGYGIGAFEYLGALSPTRRS
jgi:parallel beta-helix repeat protein